MGGLATIHEGGAPAGAGRLRSFLIFFAYAYAALFPFSIGAGSVLSGVLIVGGLVLFALDPAARAAIDRPVLVTLVALVIWLVIATAFSSPHPTKWKDCGQLLWLKLHVVTTVAILHGRPGHTGRILATLVLGAVVVAVLGFGQHFTGRLPFEDEIPPMRGDLWEIEGYFGHHLTYGGHIMVLWMAALALAVRDRGRRRSLAFGIGAVAVLGLALFWTYARSPQIGAIAGAAALALTLPRRLRVGVAAVLAIAVVAAALSPQMRQRFGEMGDLSTEETRLNLWRSSWSGIQDRPWTGYGPGNFGSMMEGHEVEGFYDAKSHAHNDWIMHAVNMGLPGAAIALSFFAALAFALLKRLRSGALPPWVVRAALSSLVAVAIGGLFQVFQSDDEVEMTVFFVAGCALSATAAIRDPAREMASSDEAC